jgi:tetratricopeptide (TPR) repeat protein
LRFQVDAAGFALPPQTWMGQAAQHYRAGEHDAAMGCCHAALQEQAQDFDALHLLGVLETDAGNAEAAIEWLQRAIAVRADVAQAHYHLGNALLAGKRERDALGAFAIALAQVPDHVDALNNMGNALRNLERYDEAIACYRKAIAIRADFAAAHYNLGRTLAVRFGPEAAIASLRAALAGDISARDARRLADVYGELGRALLALDRVEEALETCHALRARLPDEPSAAWNESLVLLQLGRYREAWPKYEQRFTVPDHDKPRAGHHVLDLNAVAGKRVLLAAEQGRGDIIQFARYAPLLARRGAEVVVEAYPDLVALLRTLAGVADVIEIETETPHDLLTSLLSLPMAFGTEVETIPATVPYLQAPRDRLRTWRRRLGPRTRPRIGIAWWGAQHIPERSMPITVLEPLLRVPGIEFHALQKEIPTAHADWLAANKLVKQHEDALRDFADTAALITEMDLVVSIDTAVAHLAGALCKPVWIMLVRGADWRWLRHRLDSPWYPTARLFRRSGEAGWSSVVDAVVRALPSAIPLASSEVMPWDLPERFSRDSPDILPPAARAIAPPVAADPVPRGSNVIMKRSRRRT